MGEPSCRECGADDLTEQFTVDRLGVCHWFERCSHCGYRRAVQHLDPACDNPYARMKVPSWRPDVPREARLA